MLCRLVPKAVLLAGALGIGIFISFVGVSDVRAHTPQHTIAMPWSSVAFWPLVLLLWPLVLLYCCCHAVLLGMHLLGMHAVPIKCKHIMASLARVQHADQEQTFIVCTSVICASTCACVCVCVCVCAAP